MADKVRVRLVRSAIGSTTRVRETLRGLGLTRVGRERELIRTPAVAGMLQRVLHLIVVESQEQN